MTVAEHSKTLDKTIVAIQALDLSLIKFKSTRNEDGYGWSVDYADKMEVAYKRYLILHAKYPEMALAPEQDIDRFWHMHILDTRKYAADCQASFGHFVHHFPYLGLRGKEDAKALDAAFLKMQELYAQEFGEPVPALQRDAAYCGVESGKALAAYCGIEADKASAAYCGIESSKVSAAYCGIESGKPSAAYCGVESGKSLAAYCGIESSNASAAYCGIESSNASAAYCGIESSNASAAYCGIESSNASAAYCGIESSKDLAAR
jgi:hypothetical protein